MTDKKLNRKFSLKQLKSVTDRLNSFNVDLRLTSIYYPGYSATPAILDTTNTCFEEVIEEFALCFANDALFYLRGSFERYLSNIIEEDYNDLIFNSSIYNKHFSVVFGCNLTELLYKKDILFVYNNGKLLVCTSNIAKKRFRKLRGNE